MAPELAPALALSKVPMSAQDMMLDAADGVIDGKVDASINVHKTLMGDRTM